MSKQTPLPVSSDPSGEPPFAPALWNGGKPNIKATHNCYTYMMNDLYRKPRVHGKPQPGYFFRHMKNVTADNVATNRRLTCAQVKKGVMLDNPHVTAMSLEEGQRASCPPRHYKGFLMVSPGNDYHFARQDNRMISVYRHMDRDIKAGRLTLPRVGEPLARVFVIYAARHIPSIVLLAHKTFPADMRSRSFAKRLKRIEECAHTWSHKPGATDATDRDASGDLILNPVHANWNYETRRGGINYSNTCCFFSIPTNKIANTFSTGVGANSRRDNPTDIRTNIDREPDIDGKYEKLLRAACAGA